MLVQLVSDIPETLRDRISALIIEHCGGWICRCSYCYFPESVPGEPLDLRDHTVNFDKSRIPAGVTARTWERWPDSRHQLVVDEADYLDSIETMIRHLGASGMLGALDVCRFMPARPEDLHRQPAPKWIIKTHAGSEGERSAWLRRIRRETRHGE